MMDATSINELAYEFFREFARCEYCLKAVGLRENTRDARANWGAFANDIRQTLEAPNSEALKLAVDYYLGNPPKKQVVHHDRLEWEPTLPDHAHQAELVLRLVCRVRNNLFHGGKFNGHWFEPERSEELLSHGLVILRECVAIHPRVREAYAQRAV
jgi:hypothetical protein